MTVGEASHLSDQRNRELTPLQTRLLMGLQHLASEQDELQPVVSGFVRYMRKHPIPDEEIRGGLESIASHIRVILDDEHSAVGATA